MHILVLNEYYPPDTSATAKCAAMVVEALAQRHKVTVLAGRPSYDPSRRHPPYLLRRETHGNVTVERVGSTAFPRFNMKGRLANYFTYLALAVPRAVFIRADIVIAMTDPPFEGLAGALVCKLTRRPFVYNLRDMYPDMAVGGNIVRPGWKTRIWESLHRKSLRSAARIIVLGEDMRERILAKGVSSQCITVIRDAVDLPPALPGRDHPVVRQIRGEFRFVLIHAGNIGFYGAWNTLLEAARILQPEGVGLVFVGEGAMKDSVQAAARGCNNIRFMPFRPASELPCVMAAGDLHVVTVKRGLEGVVVPSKVYNILAAGRPLLAVATERTEVARFAARDGCGLAADPDDPCAVAAAVRGVLTDTEKLAQMARNSRALAESFDRVKELRKFVQTIEEVHPARRVDAALRKRSAW